jgi:hypothetical protein
LNLLVKNQKNRPPVTCVPEKSGKVRISEIKIIKTAAKIKDEYYERERERERESKNHAKYRHGFIYFGKIFFHRK